MDTTQQLSSPLSLDGEEVDLGKLTQLVKKLDSYVADIIDHEKRLKTLNDEKDLLSRTLIPELMDEFGIEAMTLVDGRSIKVKQIIKASINKDNRESAYEWLKEKGHADIIKSKVTFKTTKGHEAEAIQVLEAIQAIGFNADKTDEVHWQTLNAWAREQYGKGMEFPESIGIFEFRDTEVK